MLRLSLLQGEGGNICHYQIDGHKPVYQITAVGGVFNGFFFFFFFLLTKFIPYAHFTVAFMPKS